MNLELLDFQGEIKQILLNTRKKNRLSHAYIFQGPSGVGKNEMAHFFAAMLYSNEGDVSLDSETTKLIFNDEHVNVYVVKADGKMIKKEQIVALQNEFSRTSQVAGPRVYIILDADLMNATSQNSLLKFIEEPQPGLYGILCTSNISRLLPTITSRCQFLNFKALDNKAMAKMLINYGIEKNLAIILAIETKSVVQAKELATDEKIIKLKSTFEDFLKIKSKSDAVQFKVKSASFLENAESLVAFLNLLVILYEDIMILYQASLNVTLSGYVDKINKLKEYTPLAKAMSSIELIYSLNRMLLSNVSPKAILLNLLVNLF